ncbi:hypothetical protein PAXRUDRAFT_828822 [Paxillus rubicundulus Ve08.2h10]|uniref:Uncharacterized protein n=1 Tax=Paxillus rubicundulus Ve08.2h10 TaxID=930991 RepID=A0A0D0D990_9AGAM|nr:hypothetical protein PAXRUDRAFT_828822 [Paxillus rubicundulus Ve08.2h10]
MLVNSLLCPVLLGEGLFMLGAEGVTTVVLYLVAHSIFFIPCMLCTLTVLLPMDSSFGTLKH